MPCTCGVESGGLEEAPLAALRGVVAQRLARAWFGLGCGGMALFLASTVLAAHHYAWSTLAAMLAGTGGTLVVRALRVVSKTRRNLLEIAARAALPPARIVP
jgi:hypothetical protein